MKKKVKNVTKTKKIQLSLGRPCRPTVGEPSSVDFGPVGLTRLSHKSSLTLIFFGSVRVGGSEGLLSVRLNNDRVLKETLCCGTVCLTLLVSLSFFGCSELLWVHTVCLTFS